MADRYILYRVYNDAHALLYVGATTNPGLRFASHAYSQPWWDEACEIKLQHYPNASALDAAEIYAIATEGSRYNLVHCNEPHKWGRARKPHRAKGSGSIFRRNDGMWVASIEVWSPDGKRKQRRAYAKDRDGAEVKLANLLKEVSKN
jgi:hypothetical protein